MAKAAKTATKKVATPKRVENILISQPKPESEKSPYFDLAKKFNVNVDFYQFIQLEGLTGKEFRKQKIELAEYTGVILLSRNAVDHFFRMCDEMKFKVSPDLRYFCITEAVALYLQKFILYRKRKVFFSADGSHDGLLDVLAKYKDKAKFLLPVSENTKNEISHSLVEKGYDFQEAVLYRTVGRDLKPIFEAKQYDIVVMFSPFGVETLTNSFPDFNEKGILIGAFGTNTCKCVEEAGLTCTIPAPVAGMPSMVAALTAYLNTTNKPE